LRCVPLGAIRVKNADTKLGRISGANKRCELGSWEVRGL